MKNVVLLLALSLTPVSLQAVDSATEGAGTTVIEVHPSHLKFFELARQKRVSLPQLRVYDRSGRLRHDFGFGFEPRSFGEQFEAILRSPVAQTTVPVTLAEEVEGLLDSSEHPLSVPPAADLVMVEYSATWCEPCHAQKKALLAQLQQWPALKVVLLHVSIDGFAD